MVSFKQLFVVYKLSGAVWIGALYTQVQYCNGQISIYYSKNIFLWLQTIQRARG
jgi:hypothetical protein